MRSRFSLTLPLLILLTLFLLASLPAQAGCCVCEDAEVADTWSVEDISVCYTVSAESDCGVGRVIGTGRAFTTVDGVGKLCKFFPSLNCSNTQSEGLTCPNVLDATNLTNAENAVIRVNAVQRDAIAFTPQVSIPGTDFIAGEPIPGGIQPDTIAKYIAGIYYFLIASIGILAVVGIMVGGFQYLMAAGSPEKITEAKHSITSAIIGLIVALTSYLLFTTINPDLVDFQAGVGRLTDVESEEALINSNLDVGECPAVREPDMALLDTGIFKSTDPIRVDADVERPARLRLDVVSKLRDPRLTDWIKTLGPTARLVIKSAYRSQANQTGLYACYRKRISGTNVCPFNCTSCNQAAPPSCNAPHQTGFAVDVCLENVNAAVNDAACNLMKDTNKPTDPSPSAPPSSIAVQLQRKMGQVGFGRYYAEWWHFESKSSIPLPSKWCPPGIYTYSQAAGCTAGGDSGDNADQTAACAAAGGQCMPVCGGGSINASCPTVGGQQQVCCI